MTRKTDKSGEESVNSCEDWWDCCQNLGIAHSSLHFQVELKSCELFQWFCTSLATCPPPRPPVERAWPSEATSPELSHGTCIQPGHVGVRLSLWRSPLGASPKSGRLLEHWVDDRPGSIITRSDLGWLLSWRCALGALVECDCHRELSQIQASSLNSLKYSILQIQPDPFLNVT